MNQRSLSPARALAAAAVAAGFVILLMVIVLSLAGGDGNSGSSVGRRAGGSSREQPAPASYVVQNGDTLTSIAHRTGVSVDRIQELNPGVDPQILVSGEKLKLRETP